MSQHAPFIHNAPSVRRTMLMVVLALVPAWLAYYMVFGVGVIIQTLLVVGFAYLFELLMLKLRNRPIRLFITDYSVLITALALAFCIPPYAPWWVAVTAIFFAVVIAKHLFGGLGYNPFNPAMFGYAVVLISYPAALSLWPEFSQWGHHVDLQQALNYIFQHQSSINISSASPLDLMHNRREPINALADQHAFSQWGQSFWHWFNVIFAVCGIVLVALRIAAWQVPTAVLLTLLIISGVFWLINPLEHVPPWWHLFHGATMIGAFIIATDPVSCATSSKGKWVFGILVGVLIFIIREWGNYPDAVAFAVLIGNLSVPLIDHYTRHRVYGT